MEPATTFTVIRSYIPQHDQTDTGLRRMRASNIEILLLQVHKNNDIRSLALSIL